MPTPPRRADLRLHASGEPPAPVERRRASWSEFRDAYPGLVTTFGIALLFFIAIDLWLGYRWWSYREETSRLRAGMSAVERRRADVAVANEDNELQVMMALARRQAQVDQRLHLSVSTDSGRMTLEREGARLRVMPVELGPERRVGVAPDTVHLAVPRGTRTIERILGADDAWTVPRWVYESRGLRVPDERALRGALGPVALALDGGVVVYSMPSVGPLNDSSYVLPGSVRARAADLKAILPNAQPGMRVYFY